MYALLKDNPLVDSTKLTKYLLDNMIGVQFDDMLQPQEGVGTSQENPNATQSICTNATTRSRKCLEKKDTSARGEK